MSTNEMKSTNYKEISNKGYSQIAAKILPKSVFLKIKHIKSRFNYFILNIYDSKSFIKSMNSNNSAKAKYNTLINTHILEKGLSHEKIRFQFGRQVLIRLSNNLTDLNEYKLNESEEFSYALSTLHEYYILHKENGINTDFLKDIFGNYIFSMIANNNDSFNNIGGTLVLKKSDKENNRFLGFDKLAKNRFTIRNFQDSEVNFEFVEEAISIAKKSPSACNRQSSKIIAIKNQSLIKEILEVQGGFRGYQIPKVLLISLTDNNAYSSYTDRYMGYVDGGLFTMSLIYGLEFVGLGACLLNASFDLKKEKKIKKIASISENEKFIALIAVGNIPDETKIAVSYRLDEDNILRVIE